MEKQNKNNRKITTGISLPKHMMDYLHHRAEMEGVSTSELVRYLVREMWDKELAQIHLLQGDARAEKVLELQKLQSKAKH